MYKYAQRFQVNLHFFCVVACFLTHSLSLSSFSLSVCVCVLCVPLLQASFFCGFSRNEIPKSCLSNCNPKRKHGRHLTFRFKRVKRESKNRDAGRGQETIKEPEARFFFFVSRFFLWFRLPLPFLFFCARGDETFIQFAREGKRERERNSVTERFSPGEQKKARDTYIRAQTKIDR